MALPKAFLMSKHFSGFSKVRGHKKYLLFSILLERLSSLALLDAWT